MGGLMVSTLAPSPWIERSGFELWPGTLRCVLEKTRNSHSTSLHTGFEMGTGKFNDVSNPAMD